MRCSLSHLTTVICGALVALIGGGSISPAAAATPAVPIVQTQCGGNLGYTVRQSGLGFRILRGVAEPARDREVRHVVVMAEGRLSDGTVFWRSQEPIGFELDSVIAGWREGLPLMIEGDVFLFCVPSNLAYGVRGRPPAIPPNATLYFKIGLLSATYSKDTEAVQ